jgi:antitoxin YqcF
MSGRASLVITKEKWSDIGAGIFDHYQRHLGVAVVSESFSLEETNTLQVLRYERVFDGCQTYASLGYCRYGRERQEIVLVAEGSWSELPGLLARVLLTLGTHQQEIVEGFSFGGLDKLAPSFVKETKKGALFFTSPFLFPTEFQRLRVDNLDVKILMAIPIDADEHRYSVENGPAALELLFDQADIDPFDVRRLSVLTLIN